MRSAFAAAFALSLLAFSADAAPFPADQSQAVARGDASNPTVDAFQATVSSACNAGACTIAFPPMAHTRTLVSHVSCFFQIPSTDNVFSVQLSSSTGSQVNFVGVEKYGTLSGFASYVVNAPTYLFFASGEVPIIGVVATGTVSSLRCTISGNYH